MTDDTRGALADLAVVGVAALTIYFVARNPWLRRTAWQAVKYGLFTAGPAFLWHETSRAWALSAPPDRRSRPIRDSSVWTRDSNQE